MPSHSPSMEERYSPAHPSQSSSLLECTSHLGFSLDILLDCRLLAIMYITSQHTPITYTLIFSRRWFCHMTQPNPSPFRIPEKRGAKPSDPESLFRSLSRRASHVQHLWAHQADVLRKWHSTHADTPDLALELPTGTGKTLVGLLIGDFVRQTKAERVAYLCPNRQLAYQVGALAADYSINARVLVGQQASYNSDDFNAFEDSSALAITTYSALFNTNPRIKSANLLVLDDAHASESFIASLWNLEVNRDENRDLYFALLSFFDDVIPGSEMWNFRDDSIPYSRTECTKIPSPVVQDRQRALCDFLDSELTQSNLRYPWQMIRSHLSACHIFVTWPSISIRPLTPPTFSHGPFASARQRLYMSATLGEGGELERITGVRRIDRLPVPEGWDREGTGRRFILFPDRSLPPDTARLAATTVIAEPSRSLILTPNTSMAKSVAEELRSLTPAPCIFTASDIENSIDPFLVEKHAALVLSNRYDGLDLPGDACHLEWICDLPGATNAQETFLLNRLGVHSLLRDRIRTRLTQALGRCTRNPTDYAVVIISGPRALDFCIKSENRAGFHPELQAEIQCGIETSQFTQPKDFCDLALAFLKKEPGWEEVDQWIRDERDSYSRIEDEVAQTLLSNVQDEIDYTNAMWVANYQGALDKARSCADRLSGGALADYRAWWHYLAGSAALLSMERDGSVHLGDTARDQFARACAASPMSTWFREIVRQVDFEVESQTEDDQALFSAAEAIERRLQQVGISGPGFEKEAQTMSDLLSKCEATPFEQGLELLGFWLGADAKRPKGQGVPDGIWPFAAKAVVALEAKSNEQSTSQISVSTAREAQGHINWVKSKLQVPEHTPVSTVVISDRTTIAPEALPHTEGLYVVGLPFIRQLGFKVISTVRGLRAQASEVNNEDFRRVIAERFRQEKLDPESILSELLGCPINELPS